MKYTIAIAALLGATTARHHHHHVSHIKNLVGLNTQQGTDNRRRFLQLENEEKQWDLGVAKFMDEDAYTKVVRDAMPEEEEPAKKS